MSLSSEQKQQLIEWLNGDAGNRWFSGEKGALSVQVPAVPEFEKYQRGLLTGEDLKGCLEKIRESQFRPLETVRKRLLLFVKWRDEGGDVRKCHWCSQLFLAR